MPGRLSRRRFVLGGAAMGLLASCSERDSAADQVQLVHLFSTDRVIAAGQPQRIPFAVVNQSGLDIVDGAEVPVRVLAEGEIIEEVTVAALVVNHDHVNPDIDPDHQHADLLRYFPLRVTLPVPGIYDLEVDFGQGRIGRLPVQSFDLDEISVVVPGQAMPALQTPTFTDPAGVSPICTRAPEPCPFHEVTVAEVLDTGSPLALLVATPALCRTAYCGPVVETLIEESGDFPDVTAIHLELYANADEVAGNYNDEALNLASQVEALGLEFEPSLILVDASGIIVDRIDNLFDASELRGALAALA
ncbi:MAG: hypothetical protein GY724_20740 [Actinomycetia bacterium]|nr:hypothetical protein [Actinomycetes bacterium]